MYASIDQPCQGKIERKTTERGRRGNEGEYAWKKRCELRGGGDWPKFEKN